MNTIRITHIGGPTILIEMGGWRLLTDPTFGLVRPHIAIPVHYEGWSHFREGCAAIEAELALAPANVGSRFQFLPIGTATELAA